MRVAAVVATALVASVPFAASPATAYSITAQALGAGGFQDSTTEATVEAGTMLTDVSGNSVDGHALTGGDTGALGGHMKVHIVDYFGAQANNQGSYLLEKQWKSAILEVIEDFQLDPGATELVFRVWVSGEDKGDLVIAPSAGFDNGFARSHVRARLEYVNSNPHVDGLSHVLAVGGGDRNLPLEWTWSPSNDTSPAGYGTATGGAGSGFAELRIPASEVDGNDYLLVSGQLYGEVRGGHWNGAFAASELQGGMSFEMAGGTGVPQNPIFLSAPEPAAGLIGDVAVAALATTVRRRRSPAP